jgi:prepilin-type N-terminal cleavage/methylation domain-containing protein
MKKKGFTLVEVILVVFLVLLILSVIYPISINILSRQKEKKKILEAVVSISDLRRQSFSNFKVGMISTANNCLIFTLGGTTLKKICFKGNIRLPGEIFFNKNGVTKGGEIVFQNPGTIYKVKIEKLTGKVSLIRL